MKKKLLSISFLLVLITCLFTTCRKAGSENQGDSTHGPDQNAEKINTWLNAQMMLSDSAEKTKITLLKQNLDFANVYSEEYGRGDHFIVVPISSNFHLQNNADKAGSRVLLLFVSDTGIRKGNIVQSFNATGASHLPKGTFTAFFNSKIPDISGTLSFSTITDSRKFDVSYKDGKLLSYGLPKTKPDTSRNGRTTGCDAWFFVTYYSDGSEDWKYLFTTCDVNCRTMATARNIALKVNCGGDGSQSSGSGSTNSNGECCIPDGNIEANTLPVNDPGTETTLGETTNSDGVTTKTKVFSWQFWSRQLLWYKWTRTSLETGTLDNSSGKWKFVTLVHTGQQMDGNTPICVPVTFNMDATNVDYSDDRSRAIMTLYFTETVTVSCISKIPTPGNNSVSASRYKVCDAN